MRSWVRVTVSGVRTLRLGSAGLKTFLNGRTTIGDLRPAQSDGTLVTVNTTGVTLNALPMGSTADLVEPRT